MALPFLPRLLSSNPLQPDWKQLLERLTPSQWQTLLSPHVRSFRACVGVEGYAHASCTLRPLPEPSASPLELRLSVEFESMHTFVSTERAAALPARRQPARDRYLVVLERQPGDPQGLPQLVKADAVQRQLVPTTDFLACLEVLEEAPGYRSLLDRFFARGETGTRLEARPRLHTPSWGERLRGRVPPPPLPPPPQQLKLTLEQWVPAGVFSLRDVCSDLRLDDTHGEGLSAVTLQDDALQLGIELSEQPVSRHIHWGFRGTFVRALVTHKQLERWVWQRV